MNDFVLVARIALCAIFAIAALRKARDAGAFAKALVTFGSPPRLAPAGSVAIVAAELAVAASLLFDGTAALGAWAAVAVLGAFTSIVAANVVRGNRPACNCFGAGGDRRIGWDTVARNLMLITLGAFVASRASEAPALPTLRAVFAAFRESGTLGVGLLACAVAVAFLSWVVWQLLRQEGRMLLRLEALEKDAAGKTSEQVQSGLAIGAVAPPLAVATLDGGTATLESLEAEQRPVLLLFMNPTCGPCHALLPQVAGWQSEYADALTIALVSEGSATDHSAEKVAGATRILLQRKREVAEAYGAYGTPSAVLIDGGRIASALAQGADEIRALVSDVFDGRWRPAPRIGTTLPAVTLQDTHGEHVALKNAIDRETVMLFWNPQCGFCERMLDDVRSWEAEPSANRSRLVIVSNQPFDERAAGLQSLVLVDERSLVGTALGANGTPMAVRLDAQGRIASSIVAGRDAVLELMQLEPVHA